MLGAVVLVAMLVAAASAWSAEPAGPAAEGLRACVPDAKARCPGERPGDGRLLGCLKAHEPALSDACRAALASAAACRDELQAVCGPLDARGLRRCARDHADRLSPACRPQR